MTISEQYIIHFGDNALILGHRNSEWCGHGPVLEQDIAITNISLDLIGQARNFYQYAAQIKGNGATEDTLAYLRDPEEFTNFLMLELPRGDWAFTVLRQYFFSNYQFYLYEQLQLSEDAQVAAIAAKAIREVTYHLRWSSEWVIRLGDGTEESNRRIKSALIELWPYTAEFFSSPLHNALVDPASLQSKWLNNVNSVFEEATLSADIPSSEGSGPDPVKHTHHLTELLQEMQTLPRTYPGAEW